MAAIAIATAAAMFNLVCTGTTDTISSTHAGVETAPYTVVYRVDLEKRRFCEGECWALEDIAEVQPTFIVLQRQSSDTASGRHRLSNEISRLSGNHSKRSEYETRAPYPTRRSAFSHGTCARQPFSGFPTFETKF